jgi:hypothetical protein
VITVQQTAALKVVVKDAVNKAIEMMATGAATPTAGSIATQVNSANPDLAITHNVSILPLVYLKSADST